MAPSALKPRGMASPTEPALLILGEHPTSFPTSAVSMTDSTQAVFQANRRPGAGKFPQDAIKDLTHQQLLAVWKAPAVLSCHPVTQRLPGPLPGSAGAEREIRPMMMRTRDTPHSVLKRSQAQGWAVTHATDFHSKLAGPAWSTLCGRGTEARAGCVNSQWHDQPAWGCPPAAPQRLTSTPDPFCRVRGQGGGSLGG